jgi:FlaA1/EpsC-like NDP-sugar epimerase
LTRVAFRPVTIALQNKDRLNSMFLKKLAWLAVPIVLIALGALSAGQLQGPLYHPYLVVQGNADLTFSILQRGVDAQEVCQAATNSLADALALSCPNCRVKEATCLETLTPEQQNVLSQSPLETASAVIPNGVVVFNASRPETALAVCEGSQRQSEANPSTPGRVSCVPAGAARPLAPAAESTQGRVRAGPAALLLACLLGLAAYVYMLLGGPATTLTSQLITLSRVQKQLLIALLDLALVELTLWPAFVLRLGTFQFPKAPLLELMALAPVLAVPIFVAFGLYRSVMRYVGTRAIVSIAQAVVVYVALATAAVYLLPLSGVPRSVLIIHGVLVLVLIAGSRVLARAWLNHPAAGGGRAARHNVVIYGAGAAGMQLALALSNDREVRPVAFIDDDTRLHRKRMGDLEVFGPQRLQEVIDRHRAAEVLLALPSISRRRRAEIVDMLESFQLQVRTLPTLSDLAQGRIKIEDLREVEIEDLLGRDSVAPDPQLLRANISGKSVMVTGAGGSIGAELCRQILELQPAALVLFEQSEFFLYSIEAELRGRAGPASALNIYPILGSVTDQVRLEKVIAKFNVQTIYHAAAYKHVPMVELNPCEGAFNNVIGTYRAASAAVNNGVETFVLISTDKAVRPTNTMGASKRFAEMVVQAFARESQPGRGGMRFCAVRFGNVLGSSGSVVPLFRQQIRKGGPVTVTDPRVVRYFMTIPEAAQLVLQAGAMGRDGDVFVLDMGEPVEILDLARRMIRLSGLQEKTAERPDGDIEIVFSGLRPGEKLYEELLTGNNPTPTAHPRIMRASEMYLPLDSLSRLLDDLTASVDRKDSDRVRALLLEAVRDFRPQCDNEDLAQ